MRSQDLQGSRGALVEAVWGEYDRVLAGMAPQLDRRPEPQFADPEYRAINAAQNTLRTCLEATLERMLPYGPTTPIELALRLASYSISALPIEDQRAAVAGFVSVFAEAHQRRMRDGVRLSTTWNTQGRERANFPKGDS